MLRNLSLLFALLLIGGCGGGGGNSSTGGGSDTGSGVTPDKLTIAIVNNGHMINMQTVAQAYTVDTGIELEWVALDEEVLLDQVTAESPVSAPYDVINIGMQEAPYWGDNGWITPLTFSGSYNLNDVFPAMRAGLSSNGVLYGAPFYGESSLLMYRRDLADAASVQISDNDSWTNVAAAAAAIHNPDAGVYGICLRSRPGWGDNVALVSTIANSYGAAFFDGNMRPLLDSDQWNEAVSLYVDLLNNYGPPDTASNSFNELLALFNAGQCGIWIDASIAPSFLQVDNVALAQSPNAGFAAGANWLWAWALAVPSGTPYSAAANDFIEWARCNDVSLTTDDFHPPPLVLSVVVTIYISRRQCFGGTGGQS